MPAGLKKVLFITYYWPPSGGAGVQRPLKFARNLPAFGIQPIVITVDPEKASFPNRDPSLAEEVPPGTEVYATDTFEPFELYKKLTRKQDIPSGGFSNESNPSMMQKAMRFIRGNFFIPDARIGWNKYAYKKAAEIIRKEKIEVVITTSPPHSTHLIGLKLKEEFGITWICDINDPWTDIYYYKEFRHLPFALKKDRMLEQQVLTRADKVITVSENFKSLFLAKSPLIREEKFTLIPNGFDEEDFIFPSTPPAGNFVITYTGTIAGSYEPQVFFRALASAKAANPGVKIMLQFVGSVAGSLQADIRTFGLEENTELISHVPHRESVKYLMGSTALLLIIPHVENDKGIVPGKLFEYLAAGKPVICIGSRDCDAAVILEQCDAGKTFSRDMEQQLTMHLQMLIDKWKQNPNLDLPVKKAEQYSRRNQAKKLAELIINI
jgi:glycosyltransferase involved in cell wall biosynthesis